MASEMECKSCGYLMNNRQMKCPYCGSTNPGFENKAGGAKPFFNTAQQQRPIFNAGQPPYVKPKKKFSVFLFIILLIAFPPAAIIYAIVVSQ